MSLNSFNSKNNLKVCGKDISFYSLKALPDQDKIATLPFSLKILLENLLRTENGVDVSKADIQAIINWDAKATPNDEIAFTPARVVMQDFTGVPAIVDLAAMRDAVVKLGGDVQKINPLAPAELVIDHSVMVDYFGTPQALEKNAELEFERNAERYEFLRWGQSAFDNFKVVPPRTGIVHQVNIEYLARTVFTKEENGEVTAYPDTLVGTDSHTTMVNGLGVLGWGVGGIEAEAAMLGQAITMLVPQVVGFKLKGKMPEGATATDLVLTVTQMLRNLGVVGKFVEFYGEGLAHLPLADRATIANMAPEYGATCGIFPIDEETLTYLRLTGREDDQIELVKEYAMAQGMFRTEDQPEARYTATLELDMGTVVPSLAGPKRPQDRIALTDMSEKTAEYVRAYAKDRDAKAGDVLTKSGIEITQDGKTFTLEDGAVTIAAITSCTNTSNPYVVVASGLLARNAVAKGLTVKPWVKTSLAPGSKVVTDYLEKANLMGDLDKLGFDVVGYGCTTCIGNSGPLPEAIGNAVRNGDLTVSSVLSGNRNFEGRIHADIKMNFLASPPLVVAYALAGNIQVDMHKDPLGQDQQGNDVFLKDIWPSQKEIQEVVTANINQAMFKKSYSNVFKGDERWAAIPITESDRYNWNSDSTYIQNPPYFVGMSKDPSDIKPIKNARVLAFLGDSITTDHISPAGSFNADSPAGKYLTEQGVARKDFNSYGSRRGNHQVMMRGTFANVRLRNELAPGTEGGWTRYQPEDSEMSIYDASMKYQESGVPLIVIAGKEYGTGSSRDWAAKGTLLLGVKAVVTESYERIHRSNLVGMGVLPLQFKEGESKVSHGLTGKEIYSIEGLENGSRHVDLVVNDESGKEIKRIELLVRIDTPREWDYYQHGGILHYVLRRLANS